MTSAEWLTIVQTVGIPAAMLIAVGHWVAKYLLPTMVKSFEATIDNTRQEHSRDRDSFERAIKLVEEAAVSNRVEFGRAVAVLSESIRNCPHHAVDAPVINLGPVTGQSGGGE